MSFFPRFRFIDRPLAIQFSVAGFLVFVFSLMSLLVLFLQIRRQREATKWLSVSHQHVILLTQIERDFYHERLQVVQFLSREDLFYLPKIRFTKKKILEFFKKAQKLLLYEFAEKEFLNDISKHYLKWFHLIDTLTAQSILDLQEKRKVSVSKKALDQEDNFFKETSLLLSTAISRANRELVLRDSEEKRAVRNTFLTVSGVNFFLFLVLAFVLWRLYLTVVRPIKRLTYSLQRYQSGDFSTRVGISSRNEIGFLETSFNELAEKIEEMISHLKKLDELKSEFLSTVSHELRTPLTSILGYVKILKREEAGVLNETQKEFLSIVDENVIRLTNLINDVLDVEKIESGKFQLVKEKQNLVEILKSCSDTFRVVANQKELNWNVQLLEVPVFVFGDRSRLVQVFMNLLSNAIKYTSKGFVRLSMEKSSYAVSVLVEDSGVGMSVEEQKRLFEKFFRAKVALQSQEKGTGLGLVIVKKIVEMHDGNIEVYSQEGKGTQFKVSFPLFDQKNALLWEEKTYLFKNGVFSQSKETVRWIQSFLKEEKIKKQQWFFLENNHAQVPWSAFRLFVFDADCLEDPEKQLLNFRDMLFPWTSVLVIGSHLIGKEWIQNGAHFALEKPLQKKAFQKALEVLLNRPVETLSFCLKKTQQQAFVALLKPSLFRVKMVFSKKEFLEESQEHFYEFVFIGEDISEAHFQEMASSFLRRKFERKIAIFWIHKSLKLELLEKKFSKKCHFFIFQDLKSVQSFLGENGLS